MEQNSAPETQPDAGVDPKTGRMFSMTDGRPSLSTVTYTPAINDLVDDAKRHWERLKELDLLEEVAHLAVKGYAVIPPEKVGPMSDVVEARESLEALAKASKPEEKTFEGFEQGLAFDLYSLVKRKEIFRKWLVNPTLLAIGRYINGDRMVLNNSLGWIKSKTDHHLTIHTDSNMFPDPLPPAPHLVNVTVALTDYTLEGGCIGIVPGSHHYRRHPTCWEERLWTLMEPVECPAGSAIIIPGNTWHGAFPKTTEGLRYTLVQAYSRMYLTPSTTHNIPRELIDAGSDDFKQLLGENLWTNFDDENPMDLDKHLKSYRAQRSLYS